MAEQLPLVGVIGSGSFGTSIANLLALNAKVLLYSRNQALVEQINRERRHLGVTIHQNITAIDSLEALADQCQVIFPIVPSSSFRSMMRDLATYLRPYHILIHGTKGFDTGDLVLDPNMPTGIGRNQVFTMSEVIEQESVVVRIGCLSGPNLAREIMDEQATATVIGSRFKEVQNVGKKLLTSRRFQVYSTTELLGAELAGALKNTIALGSGILGGLGKGKNLQALLITRGLSEMIAFGHELGASPRAFLGTAGIGDLVCTATSENSRNYSFGYRIGKGETRQQIETSQAELAEGVRTVIIAHHLAENLNLSTPITKMIYRVIFNDFPAEQAIESLIRYPYDVDVNFI